MKRVYTSKGNIACFVVLMLIVFQNWISQKINAWSLFDEIFTLFLLILVCISRTYCANYKFSKFDIYIGTSVIIYWLVTTFSSFFFEYQSFKTSVMASFLGIKWFIVFWSVKYLCKSKYNSIFNNSDKVIHKVIIVFAIVENWYWINNIQNVFNARMYYNALSPIYLCAVNVMLVAILFMQWRDTRLDWVCLILLLENLIFSTKAKGYAAALLTVVIFVWVIKKNRKIKIYELLVMALLSIMLVWEKVYFYYVYASAPDHDYARYRLMATGFQILKDYFPIGTGWGTWGSYYSSVSYSPVYYIYGLENHHELGIENQKYMMDSYLASVMGESGFIGVLIIFIFTIAIFIIVNKLFRKDLRIYAAGLLCISYLCITFVEETGFANPALIGLAIVMGMIVSKWEMTNESDNTRKK